jgi:GR25 family glycosyltransferase involved in LPS biosynthesis
MKPVAWVINLDRYPQNWARMQKDWGELFDLRRVSAIDGRAMGIQSIRAAKRSHLQVMAECLKTDAPYHIIMEDDVYPTRAWGDHWHTVEAFLQSGRADWDIITMDPLLGFEKSPLVPFTEGLFTVEKFRCMGFMIYNARFLKGKFIEILHTNHVLDLTMTHNLSYTKLTPMYQLVRQYTDKVSTLCTQGTIGFYERYFDETNDMLEKARTASVSSRAIPGSVAE